MLGTDLSYADVKQLENAFSGSDAKLQGNGEFEGRKVKRLALMPHPGEASRYDRLEIWVDDASCVALKVDFEAGGKTVKRLTAPAAALQRSDGYWYASQATMRDLVAGTQTRLQVTGVRNGASMPERLFDRNTFYLGGSM